MRSPFLPEMRAQSSGFVVFGRSSFSLKSLRIAEKRSLALSPFSPWMRKRLMATYFARSTMFSMMAPELKACQ